MNTRESWSERLPRLIGRATPDAVTAAILMFTLLFVVALAMGNPLEKTMDAWYRGLWMLLPFTMQMTLIIVLASIVASSPQARGLLQRAARLPRTANQVIVAAVIVGAFLGYLNWGLGMVLSPIAGLYFAREAEKNGIAIDFPFLLATIWAANASWQFGLSASAPLLLATPGHFLESTVGVLPLSTTIWAPASILHEVLYLTSVMAVGCWLVPRNKRPVSHFPEALHLGEPLPTTTPESPSFAERLERQRFTTIALATGLAIWLYYHFFVKRLSLDINSLNTTFLLAGVLLHGNVHRFTRALEKAVQSAWPIVVIYHMYAGVAGLIQFTTVGDQFAQWLLKVSTPLTFPFLTALASTLIALFVPSSGGQWAIQGFVTSKTAVALGLSVQRGMLALSVGDHMGNLLTPFWYMVVAGMVKMNFRDFIGYGFVFASLWFVIGVAVFTFAPC